MLKFLFAPLVVAALSACATSSTPVTHHMHDVASEKPDVIAYQVPLEIAHLAPTLAGPASHVPSFQFSCTTSITQVRPPASGPGSLQGRGYVALWVWVNSATPVYFGDSDVDATGMPLCTATSCVQPAQSYETRALYCLSSSGTVTVNVQVAQP